MHARRQRCLHWLADDPPAHRSTLGHFRWGPPFSLRGFRSAAAAARIRRTRCTWPERRQSEMKFVSVRPIDLCICVRVATCPSELSPGAAGAGPNIACIAVRIDLWLIHIMSSLATLRRACIGGIVPVVAAADGMHFIVQAPTPARAPLLCARSLQHMSVGNLAFVPVDEVTRTTADTREVQTHMSALHRYKACVPDNLSRSELTRC